MTDYPEHDKMKAQRAALHTDAIGAFLDWLDERGIKLAKYTDDDFELCPLTNSTESLLAEYAGIDLKKIETEKRAMLEALQVSARAAHNTEADQ